MLSDAGRFDSIHGDEDYHDETDEQEPDKEENGMLILSRRPGERIRINDDIEILIQQVDLNCDPVQVKVGIQAPICHRVDREEIYKKRKNGFNNHRS